MSKLATVLAIVSIGGMAYAKPTIRGSSTNNKHRERHLQEKIFTGECTKSNFGSQLSNGESELASLLGTTVADLDGTMASKCAEALDPSIDLSVAMGKGPQYLKNFLDGGTTWNNNYETASGAYSLTGDKAIIDAVRASDGMNAVFSAPDGGADAAYPGYFSNFLNDGQECRMGAITCCYTGTRTSNTLPVNAEMCAHDMSLSAKSNHIKMKSYTIFNTSADDVYCQGFAWEEDSFSDAVKYNTLFDMTMTNLFDTDKGYVGNIPGAPMCGCAEQMPIIDGAACTAVIEGYKISSGTISVNLSWKDCDEGSLVDHYKALAGRGETEKFFMDAKIVPDGECEKAANSFMNDRMLVH